MRRRGAHLGLWTLALGLSGCGGGEEAARRRAVRDASKPVPGAGQPLLEYLPQREPAPVDGRWVVALGLAAEPTGYNTLLIGPGGRCSYIYFHPTTTGAYTPRMTRWNIGGEGYEQVRRLIGRKSFEAMHRVYRGPPGTNNQVAFALIDVETARRWEIRCDNHTPRPLADLIDHCRQKVLPQADLNRNEPFDPQKMLRLWWQAPN
ncbi:MAG: hypothetical protein R3236_04470 [Phycisphaeraceae bacterium]|nr:hypothetical protein [Phycisphaeraceae bacterium]